MERIDRLATAVERIADAMERQADQKSRIWELEALLEQAAPQGVKATLKNTVENQTCKGLPALSDDAAGSTGAVLEEASSRKPTDIELTKIDTIILSMDAGGRTETTIANQLNAEGLCSPQGGKWTESAVRSRLAILNR